MKVANVQVLEKIKSKMTVTVVPYRGNMFPYLLTVDEKSNSKHFSNIGNDKLF